MKIDTKPYLDNLNKWIDSFDINSIPKETRKKWFRSYTRAYLSSIDADYEDASTHLSESAGSPDNDVDVKHLVDVIERFISVYDMKESQFVVTNFNGVSAVKIYDVPVFVSLPVGVVVPNDSINLGIIDSEMSDSGYYRVRMNIKKDNDGHEWYVLGYNPVKQPDIRESIQFYHWIHFAPSIFRESILKNGLSASKGNEMFSYLEERVYLYVYDLKYELSREFRRIMHQKSASVKKDNQEWDVTYDVYEVVKSKVPKNAEVFYDPNVSSCVYLKRDVPKNALRLKKSGIVF